MDQMFSELQQMNKTLPKNNKNPVFLLELGKIYFDICLASQVNLSLNKVKLSTLQDWWSHHMCIKYAYASFQMRPTIDALLLMMNAYNAAGNYSSTTNLYNKNKLYDEFPNEHLTLVTVLIYSFAKAGKLHDALTVAKSFWPEAIEIAQKKLEDELSFEWHMNRNLRIDNSYMFKGNQTDEGFLEHCMHLIQDFEQEMQIVEELANFMERDSEKCFSIATGWHQEGHIKLAMQMYALASVLDSSKTESEIFALASLHILGEHEIAFQKLSNFIDTRLGDKLNIIEPWAYVIACNSCATINNITGLEKILIKAKKNNVQFPFRDFIVGFYYESSNQHEQAIKFYQKKAQAADDEFEQNSFNMRIARLTASAGTS